MVDAVSETMEAVRVFWKQLMPLQDTLLIASKNWETGTPSKIMVWLQAKSALAPVELNGKYGKVVDEFDGEHIFWGIAREVLFLLYITQFYKSILCLNDHISGKQSKNCVSFIPYYRKRFIFLRYKKYKW